MSEQEDYFTPLAIQIVGGIATIVVIYVGTKIIEATLLDRYIKKAQRKLQNLDITENQA
jgi:hypothetical protein